LISRRNREVLARIQAADFGGASPADLKPLYVEASAFDLSLDAPIFRVFQLPFLEPDIVENRLTFVPAIPDTWGDEYENPLLRASYPDPVTGGRIYLDGVVGDFHALSWTKRLKATDSDWQKFSHGSPAARVGTTPRKLLNALMDVSDEWFMLRFRVGTTEYRSQAEIDAWISNPDYSSHLDPQGQELACSLLLLRSFFSTEEEVRLLCSPLSNEWSQRNVRRTPKTLSVPMQWDRVVDSFEFAPSVRTDVRSAFAAAVSSSGIQVP
jgi:hypothetical protein